MQTNTTRQSLLVCDALHAIPTATRTVAQREGRIRWAQSRGRKIVKEVENPEAGWDDETQTQVVVEGYRSGREEKKCIALTARMFEPVAAERRANKAEGLRTDILALPPLAPIKIRVSAGVFEVTLVRVNEERRSVETSPPKIQVSDFSMNRYAHQAPPTAPPPLSPMLMLNWASASRPQNVIIITPTATANPAPTSHLRAGAQTQPHNPYNTFEFEYWPTGYGYPAPDGACPAAKSSSSRHPDPMLRVGGLQVRTFALPAFLSLTPLVGAPAPFRDNAPVTRYEWSMAPRPLILLTPHVQSGYRSAQIPAFRQRTCPSSLQQRDDVSLFPHVKARECPSISPRVKYAPA
ncbi:hypothetical protein R3P38DRAFT_3216081 [Favolaschia claudopus]|uniref:Uncharacterized protein n=1 Tax=Favolaschia claudopus TaxID=2862362 RepID=A0AAW0A7C3_9AGAR